MLADVRLAVSAVADGLQLGILGGVVAQEHSRDGSSRRGSLYSSDTITL
jgi:hypothetical protein